MGNCCSGQTVDNVGDIKTLDHNQLRSRITMEQLALIVKVQATIRGYLTRKKVRIAQMNMGMGHGYYDPNGIEVADDYDNPKVQVSEHLPFSSKRFQICHQQIFLTVTTKLVDYVD